MLDLKIDFVQRDSLEAKIDLSLMYGRIIYKIRNSGRESIEMINAELEIKRILSDLTQHRRTPDIFDLEDTLEYDLKLDSLAMIELINQIEKVFDLRLSDEDLMQQEEWMQTIGSIVLFVDNKIGTNKFL